MFPTLAQETARLSPKVERRYRRLKSGREACSFSRQSLQQGPWSKFP